MKITNVLAGIAVSDHDASTRWYGHLLGRTADARPMNGLAEWHYSTGHIQLVADPARAGSSMITLQVENLNAEIDRLATHAITADVIDTTTSTFVTFASITDPDGTTITLVEPRST